MCYAVQVGAVLGMGNPRLETSAVTRPVCPFDAVQCKLSELTSPGQR
jgi:hypothetical protein